MLGGAPDEVKPAGPLPARRELLVLHAAAHEHNLLEAHDVHGVDIVSVRSNGRPSAQSRPPPTVAVLLSHLPPPPPEAVWLAPRRMTLGRWPLVACAPFLTKTKLESVNESQKLFSTYMQHGTFIIN